MLTAMTLEKFEEACRGSQQGNQRDQAWYTASTSANSTGNKVYLKPENMQMTGAYKIRGAYYKISTLSVRKTDQKGLITASAGNHAQGVAYAAKEYGCKGGHRNADYQHR